MHHLIIKIRRRLSNLPNRKNVMHPNQDYIFYATMAHGEAMVVAHHDSRSANEQAAKHAIESGKDTYVLQAVCVYRRPEPVAEMTKLCEAPQVAGRDV